MKYIKRHLERKFIKMNDFFKAVLVTGARQAGKTTMLKHLAEGKNYTYVNLDNSAVRILAQSDPALFFQTYKPPILIDEIQKAPGLLEQIKIMCDESEETGRFWLTGSRQFKMMENVRETLAGRVGILNLYSLSQTEKAGVCFENDLDFTYDCFKTRRKYMPKNSIMNVYEHIWRGGMPSIVSADPEEMRVYFDSYLDTYVIRDAVEDGGITDVVRYRKFITACAAITGGIVNYATLAEGAGISQPTAREWLSLLEGMNIVFLLPPYSNNALKRLVKAPKLYFCDTGLAAHLSLWLTPETLMNGAAAGRFYENYVVSELFKYYSYSPVKAALSYYRDSNVKEVDILIEANNFVHPIEIKRAASPNPREVKKFALFEKAGVQTGPGGIICMCEDAIPIDAQNCFIPSNLL